MVHRVSTPITHASTLSSQPDYSAGLAHRSPGDARRFWIGITWLGIIVGAVLRFVHLGQQSLWFDEGYTAWMVAHGPGQIIRLVRADTAPPLYYLLLHGWTNVFGHSEIGLRSMSAVFSILTLLLMVRIAQRFVRSPAAVAAIAWALALGFRQQFYAQEARFYALMALLTVLILELVLRHLAGRGRGWLVPIAVTLAVAMYVHNMMAPYLLALVPAWLIFPSEHSLRRRLADGAIAAVGAFLLWLPWVVTSLGPQLRMVQDSFWVTTPKSADFLRLIEFLMSVPSAWLWNHLLGLNQDRSGIDSAPAWLGLFLFVASVVVSLNTRDWLGRRRVLALGIYILFPPIFIVLYSLFATPVLIRHVFLGSATLMPVLLMMPLGTSLRPRLRWAVDSGTILVLILALGTLAVTMVYEEKEDWRGAARWVAVLPPAHRLIVFNASEGQLPFDYYYRLRPGEEETGTPTGFFDRDPPRTMLRVRSAADVFPLVSRVVQEPYPEVVVVLSHWTWNDPDQLTWKVLGNWYGVVDQQDLYRIRVIRLKRMPDKEIAPPRNRGA